MEGIEKIYLLPLGFEDKPLLDDIAHHVEATFRVQCVQLQKVPIPTHAFNEARGQYHSTTILKFLQNIVPSDALRLLGIVDVDLFVPQLNFVFGEAAVHGKVCVISLTRLRPEYYGRQLNRQLFVDRAVKEAIHELGHTFGLRHCSNPKCVMFFSNCIDDTDYKSAYFCHRCQGILSKAKELPLHVA
jgi:archaemetzincin